MMRATVGQGRAKAVGVTVEIDDAPGRVQAFFDFMTNALSGDHEAWWIGSTFASSHRANRNWQACDVITIDIDQAAALMAMPMPEFFHRYLGVDWWEEPSGQTFLLSPATTRMEPGAEFPPDPRGQCVFLTEAGRCSIYAARPSECRFSHHDNEHAAHKAKRETVVAQWRGRQEDVAALLGRQPEAVLDVFGLFSMLAGGL